MGVSAVPNVIFGEVPKDLSKVHYRRYVSSAEWDEWRTRVVFVSSVVLGIVHFTDERSLF